LPNSWQNQQKCLKGETFQKKKTSKGSFEYSVNITQGLLIEKQNAPCRMRAVKTINLFKKLIQIRVTYNYR
jgi:hypothetical protein